MSTYYLNAGGSNTAPYDTVAKGAINFYTLQSNVVLATNDIIEFVDNGDIRDYTMSPVVQIVINVGLTFKSYSGNKNKPVWRFLRSWGIDFIYAPFIRMYDICIIDSQSLGSTIYINGDYNNGKQTTACQEVTIERCKFVYFTFAQYEGVNFRFVNNITINCDYPTWFFNETDDFNNIIICNNTFYNAINSVSIVAFFNMNGFKFFNNITYTSSDVIFAVIYGTVTSTLTDYNVYYNISNTAFEILVPPDFLPLLTPIGTHNQNVDPKLANIASGDFTLQSNSPCISAGIGHFTEESIVGDIVVPIDDYLSLERPQRIHTDIGAYEYFAYVDSNDSLSIWVYGCAWSGSTWLNDPTAALAAVNTALSTVANLTFTTIQIVSSLTSFGTGMAFAVVEPIYKGRKYLDPNDLSALRTAIQIALQTGSTYPSLTFNDIVFGANKKSTL